MQVDQLPVAVVELDSNRVITTANDEAAKLLHGKTTDLLGRTIYDAMRPRRLTGEDLLVHDWHDSAKLPSTRRLTEQEVVIRRADGSEVEVVVDGAYARDDDRKLTGAVLMLRPRHRGARRPRSGVRIVSAVSHELRSPLTSVRGYTSLLLKRWEEVPEEDRLMMLQQIDRDARRISRLINELLEISRIETGRVQLNRTEFSIPALAADIVETVRVGYPELDVNIIFPPKMAEVWADRDKVTQVLTNLVENACKYASPKGICITGGVEKGAFEVMVIDQGPGIPPADLARLFQQFFRSKEGRPTGTGLGLWISRGLIEAHGGTLTAESDGQHGTTFRFTIPEKAFEEMHGVRAPENRL